MNLLPDRSHIDNAREKINDKLMSLVQKEKELNLVEIIASYHVDIDLYVDQLEDVTINAQEDLLKCRQNLKSLKKSYDMILSAYKKTSDQETKNIKWILNKKNNGNK